MQCFSYSRLLHPNYHPLLREMGDLYRRGQNGPMLFNSYSFIFLFLPLALAGYELASRVSQRAVVLWLGFASLVFYGWWQPALLIILAGSVLVNYAAAALISRRIPNRISPGSWLFFAISLNLLVLGYYKYFVPSMNFFSSTLGISKPWADIALPLGISFFTFTQIAFLVDLKKGHTEQKDLPSYLLFVTFFPHLIAGPILHHREMMPQFHRAPKRLNLSDLTVGGTWFVLGLAKKVLVADSFADPVYPIFGYHGHLPFSMAWIGTQAYMLQLYFDFSGYSDMALGLARMFSIDFPLNFNSPYKSSSIIEVWQRWHMTLGRYIFTYVYNPVTRRVSNWRLKQGKRMTREDRSKAGTFIAVVALPMMFTMFLAGIWHGAGVQFMVFGLLHGVYLSINNAWRQFKRKSGKQATAAGPASRIIRTGLSGVLTYLAFLVSLVFFRADSCAHAMSIMASMLGLHSGALPPNVLPPPDISMKRSIVEILVGMAIVWGLPNTQQILTRFHPSLQKTAWDQTSVPKSLIWSPNTGWAVCVGVLFFLVLVELQEPSTFLYFQF
jgi:D-alanyl-lipoteichoic acid acyltransferase DltB (MBOAT superfamily)